MLIFGQKHIYFLSLPLKLDNPRYHNLVRKLPSDINFEDIVLREQAEIEEILHLEWKSELHMYVARNM